MSDTESDNDQHGGGTHRDIKALVDELSDELGAWVPSTGFEQAGDETVTIEMSRANAYRISNFGGIVAYHVLEQDGERAMLAARQALGLSQEIKRQAREQRDGTGESDE